MDHVDDERSVPGVPCLPIRLPNPTDLVPALDMDPDLSPEIVAEFRSAYEAVPDERLARTYGVPLAKYIRRVIDDPGAYDHHAVMLMVAQAMRETFQQTSPTRSILGRLLSSHAEELIRVRQGEHRFHVDASDPTVDGAIRRAERIRADLPAFTLVTAQVLPQLARALRSDLEASGHNSLRMYRGVHGAGAPASIADADGSHYALRALTSWSLDRDTADTFTRERPESSIIEADIPIGCLALAPGFAEQEVLAFPVAIDREDRTALLHEFTIVSVSHPYAEY